jgi:hypothetical protein
MPRTIEVVFMTVGKIPRAVAASGRSRGCWLGSTEPRDRGDAVSGRPGGGPDPEDAWNRGRGMLPDQQGVRKSERQFPAHIDRHEETKSKLAFMTVGRQEPPATVGEGISTGKSPMTDPAPSLHEPHSLSFTFGALWRVLVILSLVWAVGGTLDGAALRELIAVPLVMAAWAFGVFILDRWVVKADQK